MSALQDQNSYNKGGFAAFLFSMVFTIFFFIYIALVHRGVVLNEVAPEQPAPQQEQAAAEAPAAVAEPKKIADIASIKEPWIETPALVEHGHAIYNTACVTCHGQKGAGDGIAGANLMPKPRNLIEGQWKYGGDPLGLFATLTNGVQGTSMASFSYLPAAERWALVHFIRSITKNKVAFKEDELKAKAASLK